MKEMLQKDIENFTMGISYSINIRHISKLSREKRRWKRRGGEGRTTQRRRKKLGNEQPFRHR